MAPPARTFLNTSFTETPSSRAREKHPTALVHPQDAERLGLGEGARVRMGNGRGEVDMLWRSFEGLQPGTVVVEGIWPNSDWTGGMGINQLIGGDPVPPAGGVAFHDTAIWLRGSN